MLGEPVVQAITIAIATVGAVLGIWNAARDWWRDTERLKVIPKRGEISITESGVQATLVIEIVNLSPFAVTVDEAGFLMRGTKHRMALPSPIVMNGEKWPCRLEGRSHVTVCASPDQDFAWIKDVTKAYAGTATGRTFTGNSRALEWMAKHGRVPTATRRIVGRQGVISSTEPPEDS